MIWPRSTPGLIERPMSISRSTRGTRSSPVKRSIEHFGHGGALRVVEERRALAGLAVEVDAGRGVEAAGAEVDALAAGFGAELAERNAHCRAGGVS